MSKKKPLKTPDLRPWLPPGREAQKKSFNSNANKKNEGKLFQPGLFELLIFECPTFVNEIAQDMLRELSIFGLFFTKSTPPVPAHWTPMA